MRSNTPEHPASDFRFPPWANYLLPAAVIALIGLATYLPTVVLLGMSYHTTAVGYRPEQPVPFDHAQHVEGLGLDCRYCHSTVEQAGFAAVPPTQTCMNCHNTIRADSENLAMVRESFAEGWSIPWKKVHDLPDYAHFNHAAHVAAGVGCASCHGDVNEMTVVSQIRPLSMGWCLECHREPELHLRPRDQVTATDWDALRDTGMSQRELGAKLKAEYGIADKTFMTSCSTCHR